MEISLSLSLSLTHTCLASPRPKKEDEDENGEEWRENFVAAGAREDRCRLEKCPQSKKVSLARDESMGWMYPSQDPLVYLYLGDLPMMTVKSFL